MKRFNYYLIAFFVFALISCDQSEDVTNELAAPGSAVADLDVSSELAVSSNMEEVDILVESGMEIFNTTGRRERDRMLNCAEVDRDTVTNTITIDFGEGCEGPEGTIRSGKIIIKYNERRLVPGAYRMVTFEDFFIDSVQVEGTRTITNTTDVTSTDSNLTFEITLVGGKLSFPDNTTITCEAQHERIWYRGENRESDYATQTGMSTGTRRDGSTYTVTILEALVYKRGCRGGRVFIPVSGIKELVSGEQTVLIDFGDGTCDNLVEVTTNGVTETIEITPGEEEEENKPGAQVGWVVSLDAALFYFTLVKT